MNILSKMLSASALSMIWMMTTGHFSLAGFMSGFVISLLLIIILNWRGIGARLHLTPDTLIALAIYGLLLCRDIFWSSIDVAWRIIQPVMPLKAGIVAVPTFEENEAIVAMSAHGITITPGQIVVDFESDDLMYVHCLDTTLAAQTLITDQHRRLKYLRRIWKKSSAKEAAPRYFKTIDPIEEEI